MQKSEGHSLADKRAGASMFRGRRGGLAAWSMVVALAVASCWTIVLQHDPGADITPGVYTRSA
jgi:hypothetical protein